MVYFDNAATTWPKPKAVLEAAGSAFTRFGANPGRSGHSMSINTAIKVYEAREKAALFFNAHNPEDVVFTQNCTHALNLAIKGFLKAGDHVIISDLEHNSVLRPVHALSEKGIITYSIAQVYPDENATVESFAAEIRPNTRLIACTHGSNVWGIKLPIAKISELAHSKGIYMLVDAAQTAGVVKIDMQKMGIDMLCTAGHKSLYGPSGTGLMITSKGDMIEPLFEGGTGSASANYNQPQDMPDKFESGTMNTLGAIALKAGMDYITNMGIDNIFNHEIKIAGNIHKRLSAMDNVQLYTRFDINNSLPVISFNIGGLSSEEVTDKLSEAGFALRGGLHCSPLAHKKMDTMNIGAARISVGMFNTEAQAVALCNTIKRLAANPNK